MMFFAKRIMFSLFHGITNTIFIIIFSCLFTSCYTTKNSNFLSDFSKDTVLNQIIRNQTNDVIKKKDLLGIYVSSLNEEMNLGINNSEKNLDYSLLNGNPENGFLVDENGYIQIHYLGLVKVEGLTTKNVGNYLQKELLPYMKDPIVSVQCINKKITVLGQVNMPKIISIGNQSTTLFDVIASCGNLKEDADTKDVVIIRDSGDNKLVKHIDLQKHALLASPMYYVQSNDVIYFKRDTHKYDKDMRKRELQTVVSLMASVFSLGILILNLINK